MTRAAVLVVLAAALLAGPAAAIAPTPSLADPRITVVTYDPEAVVELRGVPGYQMLVEFDPTERIENVAIGDALGWQVTPNRKANLLFLKPMQRMGATNMTVVTNLRRYLFRLTVVATVGNRASQVPYAVRFLYPEVTAPEVTVPGPPPAPPPQDANHAYSYQGAQTLLPSRVFDDGKFTYFQFPENTDYPAIYAVDADGGEAVVNSSMRDGYIVVDRVARGFTLRRGKEMIRLFNDGFHETGPGPLSPQPRAKPRSHWFHR